jgi:hypothetical protein
MVWMKYFIVEVDKESRSLDCVTENPIDLVADSEPIDVLGGKILAWDERGNVYSFNGAEAQPPSNYKSFGIVDVGAWGVGEPIMQKIAQGKQADLRQILVDFLLSAKKKQRRKWQWWKEHKKLDEVNYQALPLEDLITIAHKIIGGGK